MKSNFVFSNSMKIEYDNFRPLVSCGRRLPIAFNRKVLFQLSRQIEVPVRLWKASRILNYSKFRRKSCGEIALIHYGKYIQVTP